jgi:hypothetical protein
MSATPHAGLILAAQANFEGAPDPGSVGWMLHERRIWDWDRWWPLETALRRLHEEYPRDAPLPRPRARALYRLNRLCTSYLAPAMADTRGGRIGNLDREAARLLLARVDGVFDGAINGAAYPPPDDGPPNPLMGDPDPPPA